MILLAETPAMLSPSRDDLNRILGAARRVGWRVYEIPRLSQIAPLAWWNTLKSAREAIDG